jgi:hypothetical protein
MLSGGSSLGSLTVWDIIPVLTPQQVQYSEPVGVGLYSCFTFGVDLQHVCNPFSSYYMYSSSGYGSSNHYCLCYNTSQSCPTGDLALAEDLFIKLQVWRLTTVALMIILIISHMTYHCHACRGGLPERMVLAPYLMQYNFFTHHPHFFI